LTDNVPENSTQQVVRVRRDYNTWVANETREDYALRYTPSSFRKWSAFRVSNTAFGAISFLVLEAIGGTIAINYGFINAFWAILTVGLIIFLTGIPISYYAAKYGVDMDLLTRGAGFGYIGSTISSFVYASFTFILFALEASIMAYALQLAFNIPLALGYVISAIVVIPLVTNGITLISRIQVITQPIWLILMSLPFFFILYQDPLVIHRLTNYSGLALYGKHFNLALYGSAIAVGVALITQIGEQVDYLRFMPNRTKANKLAWDLGVLFAGPGWIILGMLKMLAGALLAYVAIEAGMSLDKAVNPTHMYLIGFERVFDNPRIAMAVTAFFVIISQIKINMTNAYAGSLAWSNFFARITHSHPGRVVWVVFNAIIAVILMEMNVFSALGEVLGLYSNIAIAWIAAVVADLVINKPLGLSPKGIEFRRAYLFDINPVGVGSMFIASALSTSAFLGVFGSSIQPFSPFIALFSALIASPAIASLTGGRYYLSRKEYKFPSTISVVKCTICERDYEFQDMAHCPAYQGFICSLCCCLDARCNDACKPHGTFTHLWESALKATLPKMLWPYLKKGLGTYLLLMIGISIFLVILMSFIYYNQANSLLIEQNIQAIYLQKGYSQMFVALIIFSGIFAWWIVLTSESRRVAQEESNRQTSLLMREIELHKKTDSELQKARLFAEQANEAKSRYITGISHELRTPLNSILGYAQLLDGDTNIPDNRKEAIKVVRRSGEHLLSLIEGTLDIARIEGGKLKLDIKQVRFKELINQTVRMFELQAKNKGITFTFISEGEIPEVVRADQKRLNQILINIIGNAVKFTQKGGVIFRVSFARELVSIGIEDTGHGIPDQEITKVFDPFVRGSAEDGLIGGTGLGLTISKMLTELMGGQLSVESKVGVGTKFHITLYLPEIRLEQQDLRSLTVQKTGYLGIKRKILVVDNESVDRKLLVELLQPLGFIVFQAKNGRECLELLSDADPDLILMDLAMPEMDGWEASYIIRKINKSNIPIGIVSANAFDKTLDNAAGIDSSDFIVKPVNLSELLEWIGTKLNLTWISDNALTRSSSQMQTDSYAIPTPEDLEDLKQLVHTGYMRGVLDKIDLISKTDPQLQSFVDIAGDFAKQFQLSKLKDYLDDIGHG
jgi:signal transduction histidine kinase/CheY-like chemotaxis protein